VTGSVYQCCSQIPTSSALTNMYIRRHITPRAHFSPYF
jgi:hypothetical protein